MEHDKQNIFFSHIERVWVNAFLKKGFLLQLVLTLIYIIALVIFLGYYFLYLEARKGVVLNDPLLNTLTPEDLSNYIFGLLYPAIAIGLLSLLKKPFLFLRVLQTAAIVYSIRIITLYLVKLDPPQGFIPLIDPFADLLGYGGKIISKDLFFSGHVTSLLILFLAVKNRWLKIFFFIAVMCMMVMLLWQHVHYTIDILGAIFFSLAGWWLTGTFAQQVSGHCSGLIPKKITSKPED